MNIVMTIVKMLCVMCEENGVLYSGSSIDNLFQTDFYFLQIVWTQIESYMSRSFGATDQPSHVIVASIRSCSIVII